MRVATAAEMARIDRATIEERKLPGLLLMEHAGIKVAAVIRERFATIKHPRCLIVAGGGNNGGDGFVVARLLVRSGCRVTVVCLKEEKEYRGDARTNLDALLSIAAAKVCHLTAQAPLQRGLQSVLSDTDIVVDAILGTGSRGPLAGLLETAVRQINGSGKPVVAVDLPTGLDPDTGCPLGEAIRADCTVTMGLPKPGFFHSPGFEYVGDLWVADLGFPSDLVCDSTLSMKLTLGHKLVRLVPPRALDSHKGDHGRIVVVGGSRGMTGAAVMAARSAARAGAGLVQLVVPESVWPAVAAANPAILVHPGAETPTGALGVEALPSIEERVHGADALLLGPGIGREPSTEKLVRKLAASCTVPLVVDADGLRCLPPDLSFARREVVLTPHAGEAAHLLGVTTETIARNRYDALDRLVRTRKATVILKGAYSLVGAPDERPRINPSGNPGLATAGSGDVLAGALAGLMAGRQARVRTGQPVDPLPDTVALAVYIHGLAADLLVAELATDRITAPDVIEFIPRALSTVGKLQPNERLASDRIRWI